jgi:transcription elongation factor Elf1
MWTLIEGSGKQLETENETFYYCPECQNYEPKINIVVYAGNPYCKSCHALIEVRTKVKGVDLYNKHIK